MNSMDETIGPYKVISQIGQGGMAEVYKASKVGVKGFEKIVALKRIIQPLEKDKDFSNLLLEEAKLHAKLLHPNLVQIYDFFIFEGRAYLAMEFVDGLNFKEFLIRSKQNRHKYWQLYVYILAEALCGLHYAHKKKEHGIPLNIIHRDVSPQNILISQEGIVKLTDFGIAKTSAKTKTTKTGLIKGKAAYLSPEQIFLSTLTPQSDLFSFGIVLYESLSGSLPFQGNSDFEIMKSIENNDYQFQARYFSHIPKDIQNIIHKCLHRKPSHRFLNALEVRSNLLNTLPKKWTEKGSEILQQIMTTNFAVDLTQDESVFLKKTKRWKKETSSFFISRKLTTLSLILLLSLTLFIWFKIKSTDKFQEQAEIKVETKNTAIQTNTLAISKPISKDSNLKSTFRETPKTVKKKETPKSRSVKSIRKKSTVLFTGEKGSTIYLNGKNIGTVPLEPKSLKPGKYLVLLKGKKGKRLIKEVLVEPNTDMIVEMKEQK